MSSSSATSSEAAIIAPPADTAPQSSSAPSTVAPPHRPTAALDLPSSKDRVSSDNEESAPRQIVDQSQLHAAAASDVAASGIAPKEVDTHSDALTALSPSTPRQQRSRRSTANYHHDYTSDGIFVTEDAEHDDDDTFSPPISAKKRIPLQKKKKSQRQTTTYHDTNDELTPHLTTIQQNGLITSMKDPSYKSILFFYYRQLGAMPKEERDVTREEEVKEKVLELFLEHSCDGKFWNYRNFRKPRLGVEEVDLEFVRAKISNDINRRLEYKSQWGKQGDDTTPIILSLKDDYYRQVMYTAFRKLGAAKRDYEEEKMMKDETFDLLKRKGGKFMMYRTRNVEDGLDEMHDKAARTKIANDISRRLESKARWNVLGNDDEDSDTSSDHEDEEDSSNMSNPVQDGEKDIILSVRDAKYTSIMFPFFRELGTLAVAERDCDEEERVKNEAYAALKGLGGRMLTYRYGRRPEDGLIELDEEAAKQKISNDIARRMISKNRWAEEGGSSPRRGSASKKQAAKKKVTVKKKANLGAAVKRSSRSSDKLVSIRKSVTKYSPSPYPKRVSPYPKRGRARVTFKDDVQYSVQKAPVENSAKSSTVAIAADEEIISSSRDYKCGVCGQPKKGHTCRGVPTSLEESSTEVEQTPARVQSKSQSGLSAQSPRFITPTSTQKSSFTSTPARGYGRKQRSCGKCEKCLQKDCGKCSSCLDKTKFGGPNKKRQRCQERRCGNESLLPQAASVDNVHFTPPLMVRRPKRKSAQAANLAIMNTMADEDLENKTPSTNDIPESPMMIKRAKIESVEEESMPSFEEVTASEFNDLVDLLQSSPLPPTSDTKLDWQGLYLADLSPIPVVPATRAIKFDTSKPIILGPNSAWSQRLIMTDDFTTTRSLTTPKPRASKSSLRVQEPETSDSQKFESIMSPPILGDEYAPIFSQAEDPKQLPYSPIKPLLG